MSLTNQWRIQERVRGLICHKKVQQFFVNQSLDPPPPSKSKSVGCQKAILHFQNVSVSVVLIGSLSNDDGDGSANVPEKVNSRCFKLHRSYFNSFNLSNVGDFFRS